MDMNRKVLFLTLALLCVTSLTFAQPNENNSRRQRDNGENLTELYTNQANRLAKQMDLKKDAKEKFTVLFLDYMNARHNVVNPKGGDQEGDEGRVNFDELGDEEATALIQKNFTRQEQELQVDKDYLPKFLEILTPAQTARVYLTRGGRGGNGRQDMRGGFGRGGFGGGPGGGFGGPGGPGGF